MAQQISNKCIHEILTRKSHPRAPVSYIPGLVLDVSTQAKTSHLFMPSLPTPCSSPIGGLPKAGTQGPQRFGFAAPSAKGVRRHPKDKLDRQRKPSPLTCPARVGKKPCGAQANNFRGTIHTKVWIKPGKPGSPLSEMHPSSRPRSPTTEQWSQLFWMSVGCLAPSALPLFLGMKALQMLHAKAQQTHRNKRTNEQTNKQTNQQTTNQPTNQPTSQPTNNQPTNQASKHNNHNNHTIHTHTHTQPHTHTERHITNHP